MTEETKKFANQIGYSDITPYEVVRVVSEKCLEIRRMNYEETQQSVEARAKTFQAGGFLGHTDNSVQEWTYTSNEGMPVERIRLGKDGKWKDSHGSRYSLDDKPVRHYDFNF